jgi:hypothetical protein
LYGWNGKSPAGMDIPNYCMAGLENSPAGMDIPN